MNPPATLVIDDEPAILDAVVSAAADRGIAVDRASSWDEALEKFRVGLHELVIADYQLPGSKHGLRLLASVRRLKPSTRLLLISGYLKRESGRLAGGSFVDRYLPKTATLIDELLVEIEGAEGRASEPPDWKAVAEAVLEREIENEELDRIDRVLQGDLS